MMPRNKKSLGLGSPNRFKNRRTSLNVNLSYISSTSLLTEDETNASSSSTCSINIDSSVERTILEKTSLPVRRNLSLKRFVGSNQVLGTRNSSDQNNMTKIKPSFVRIVRISTTTPLTTRNGKLVEDQVSEETFVPSENTKRSSVLEDVRFPLEGEIFSPSTSIVMETSMDMTEVQGVAVLNSEPVASELLNPCPGRDTIDDSLGVIEDTDVSRYDIEEGMEAAIIPDSEQDSINTIRTSLNVNTSLDSRFSSMPNSSLYDPKKMNDKSHDYILGEDQLEGALSHTVSESSDGHVPANSVVVTTAVIERENSSNDTNYEETIGQEPTINLKPRRESHPLHNTSLQERIQSKSVEFLDEKSNANDSGSTEASSSTDQDDRGLHLRISTDENEITERITLDDVARKPIKNRKKKLFGLRRSEMVDLSPVATQIVPKRRVVSKKRVNRRNKTAKKSANRENDDATNKPVEIYSSDDDDVVVVDLEPKKGKRVRKLKSKKIVVKKKPDPSMWKRMKENTNTMNESYDDISFALGRTSLEDFQPKNNVIGQKNRKIKPKIIIVATGLPLDQKLIVKNTVTTLGSAKLEKIVTRRTTHVVSKGTRTVNLLRGIVRGCWLVSFEWISKSHEAGEWVNPEEYEITSFSKAVQVNRKEKQLFGAAYVSELFLTCGLIHIKEKTSTPVPVLKELVRIAGGRVAAKPEEAKIIIGRGGFKEIWILDSITNGELQPLEQYCKKKC